MDLTICLIWPNDSFNNCFMKLYFMASTLQYTENEKLNPFIVFQTKTIRVVVQPLMEGKTKASIMLLVL